MMSLILNNRDQIAPKVQINHDWHWLPVFSSKNILIKTNWLVYVWSMKSKKMTEFFQ